MPDSDLMFRPALELAAMVCDGELSAQELVGISLERIEQLDPTLGAFVDVDGERALRDAAKIGPGDPRPFAGVPTAIKNNRPVAGMRLTYGCSLMERYVADYDHNVTRRLRDAGFVIVGTTTLPEYGILPTTEARLFGPTRNPWDLERTPGGSSGGAAAAVAAGMLPVAHGNDGGGSVRIPAACCGLVGLKPSRGRISAAPELGDSSLGIDGMLTRTVADTAAILDVLAGYEPGDATWAPPPQEPFAASAAREPGVLRIAAATSPPVQDAAVDPACARAVEDAAALLRSLGHEVEEVDPPWHDDGLRELFGVVFSRPHRPFDRLLGEGRWPRGHSRRHGADELGDLLDGPRPERDRQHGRRRAPAGLRAPARDLPRALRHPGDARARGAAAAARERSTRPCPSRCGRSPARGCSRRSPPLQRKRAARDRGAAVRGLRRAAAGGPARGPPRRGGELLALAAQLEAARPWADRRPALAAGVAG